jgi:16S rRNA (adenine1518-N6/adenine1519-N6)-dimethyltransferase
MNPHPSTILRSLEQRARKRFGQNFLCDERAVAHIADLSGAAPGVKVLEIGPGLGALTRVLSARRCELTAVELDRDLAEYIRGTLPSVNVIQGDALKVDLDELAPGTGWHCAANLPYNVGTRILLRLLPEQPRFSRLVLMFQKEVAKRITAEPRTKAYGSLSLMAQAFSRPRLAFTLPPGAFHPAPKIHSAVVAFDLRKDPLTGGASPKAFERAVRAGFSQRRKRLANALSNQYTKELALDVLASTVGEMRRAEELSLEEWGTLANALEQATR